MCKKAGLVKSNYLVSYLLRSLKKCDVSRAWRGERRHNGVKIFVISHLNLVTPKGQLISKANCQAVNSSKKRTNSFLLLCDVFSFIFWKKLKTPKRHFEIIWPLKVGQTIYKIKSEFWVVTLFFEINVLFLLSCRRKTIKIRLFSCQLTKGNFNSHAKI